MKKIVLTDVEKIEIVESPIPVPRAGEAVVRIQYAGICGSDLHVFQGLHPSAKLPLVMGHEACGTIYTINSARTDVKINDKVCFHTVSSCGFCENCCIGRENLCTDVRIMGTNMDGVFTQYMLVDASRLIKLDENVDMRLGALIEPLTVGIHDVRRSGLSAGENVFIAGAGPIGLIIAIVAQLSGAAHIVMSEINPIRAKILQKFGFIAADPTKPDFQNICNTSTSGNGFDVAFEVTSLQAGFDTCLHQIKPGGVIIQVGMPPKGTPWSLDIDKIIYGETELRGVRHHTMSSMQTAAEILNSGIINRQLGQLISAIYPFEQCTEAFLRASQDKAVLRILMDFS